MTIDDPFAEPGEAERTVIRPSFGDMEGDIVANALCEAYRRKIEHADI